jgi:hypothetical protein
MLSRVACPSRSVAHASGLMLGGIPIHLEERAPVRWRLALAHGEAPELRLRVAEVLVLPSPEGSRIYDGPRFSVWEHAGGLDVHLRDVDGHPRIGARIDPLEPLVDIACLAPRDSADRQLRDEVLPELIVAHLCPLRGRAYLHASGTVGPRGVRLFLGPSGEGKSTAAQLLVRSGHRLFASDRCAAWEQDRLRAAAVPWHGGVEHCGASADLEALFVLDRRGHPGTARIEGARALEALCANAFLPRWWPEGLRQALDALHRLATRAPIFTLCSEADARLVRRVERAVETIHG